MSTGAIPPAGGVGGSDHQVQVNSGGVFAGIDNDSSGKVLTSNGAGSNPTFQTGATSGITQLTGDVTAGPGTGSQAATLASTAVTPGSYTAADITVDAKGRVTAAASGGSGGTVTHTGALTANQLLKGNAAADITVGNLTGDVTTSGSMATTLADTAVTPGSYTATNLTVDSKGRITAAANGSAGGGTVTTSGSPANGNLAKFTGGTTISNADLTGDVTTSGTVATTLKTAAKTRAITFAIDGGGSALTTGIKADVYVPYACTITAVTMLADQSGSIVVDIWKDTYANYPPVVGDSITASAKPTITTATKSQDNTLTGWTTSVSAGDSLRFNIDSITTVTRLALTLTVTV